VRGVRAGRLHGRRDRRSSTAVRAHHRRRGGLLGDQRAHAQPGALRHAAAKPKPGRGPRVLPPVQRFFDWIIDRYGRSSAASPARRRFPCCCWWIVWAASGIGKVRARRLHSGRGQGLSVSWPIELPEGASLQRSDEVLKQVEEIVGNTEGVRSAVGSGRHEHPQLAQRAERRADVRRPRTLGGAQGSRPPRQGHRRRVEQEIRRHPRRARLRLRPAAAAGLRQRLRLHHAACRTAPAAASTNSPAM
jgi:multidrug efflux pump subunit AcrB